MDQNYIIVDADVAAYETITVQEQTVDNSVKVEAVDNVTEVNVSQIKTEKDEIYLERTVAAYETIIDIPGNTGKGLNNLTVQSDASAALFNEFNKDTEQLQSINTKSNGLLTDRVAAYETVGNQNSSCVNEPNCKPSDYTTTRQNPNIRAINMEDLYEMEKNSIALVKFLGDRGLVAKQKKCTLCGKNMKISTRNTPRNRKTLIFWKCSSTYYKNSKHGRRKKLCNMCKNIVNGTWFSRSNLPLGKIVRLMYMWSMQYTLDQILRELRVSHSTVLEWINSCQDICIDVCIRDTTVIGGMGKIIEIDESRFERKKYNKLQRNESMLGLCGVEKGTGKCFLLPMADRMTEIPNIIGKWILPGSIIMSSCWEGYNDIRANELFKEITVKHSLTFLDKDIEIQGSTFKGLWQYSKILLPSYYKKDYLGYMVQFIFFQKCKILRQDPFHTFLKAIASLYDPTGDDDDDDRRNNE